MVIVFPDVCRELHFLYSVSDKALVGHGTRTVKVKNADQCEIRCYQELACLSYNLGPYKDNGHACELSNSDHLRHPDDLVPMPGFTYRGTEVHDLINFVCSSISRSLMSVGPRDTDLKFVCEGTFSRMSINRKHKEKNKRIFVYNIYLISKRDTVSDGATNIRSEY